MRTNHRMAGIAVAVLGLAFVSSETHAAGTQFAPGAWATYSSAGLATIVEPAVVVVRRGVAVRRAPVARRAVVVRRPVVRRGVVVR